MGIYIVYWNSYAVFDDYCPLRIPLPLTKLQMMLIANERDVGVLEGPKAFVTGACSVSRCLVHTVTLSWSFSRSAVTK